MCIYLAENAQVAINVCKKQIKTAAGSYLVASY